MSANESLAGRAFPAITVETLRAYAEASGDPNRIHLDEGAARAAGLPGIIAHGMLIAAYAAERARDFGRERGGLELRRFQCRFRAMTLLGDVVTISGRARREGDGGAWALELETTNQRSEVVMISRVELGSRVSGDTPR